MSITIFATLKIKEGKMDEAIAALKEAVPQVLAAEPGCLAYIPHTIRGVGNENTIIYYEKYKDKEAFKTHGTNLGKYMAKLGPLVESSDVKSGNEFI